MVIVVANNRRVDISLDTPGQQSVPQYPFNTRDSLTLLSTKGGEPGKKDHAAGSKEAHSAVHGRSMKMADRDPAVTGMSSYSRN